MYRINGTPVPVDEMARAWVEKQERKQLLEARRKRAKKYGIAVRNAGHLTIPGGLARAGAREGDFADPVNYLYPVWLTKPNGSLNAEQMGQVRNAMARFRQFSDRYDAKSRAVVLERINRAREKHGVGRGAAQKTWQAQFVEKQNERQIVVGVVLIPDVADAQGDVVAAADIEKAAHEYMIHSRRNDLEHQVMLDYEQAVPVESYIAPADFVLNGQIIKRGSWVLAVKVFDPHIWGLVKAGELTGFSITGAGHRKPVQGEQP